MGFFDFLFKSSDNSELKTLLQSGAAVVIDVRTRGEFSGGHVADSVNIPLDEVPQQIEKIKNMGKPIVFCCRSGARSGQATSFAKAQGVENVHNGGSWTTVNGLINN
jgi:rhodanese-related sulfurtransferase